jgi:hypothetical protein
MEARPSFSNVEFFNHKLLHVKRPGCSKRTNGSFSLAELILQTLQARPFSHCSMLAIVGTPRARTSERESIACWPSLLNPLFINEAKPVVFQQIAGESRFGMLALRFVLTTRKCHERHCDIRNVIRLERGGAAAE